MQLKWREATDWERDWWGTCQNTFGEEYRQLAYAKRMGLKTFYNSKSPFNFDLGGISVLDIGGGPCSLLLKCVNGRGTVVDPCDYPEWVGERYRLAGIAYVKEKAENLPMGNWDEAWIYNCLQHTENPEQIIANARNSCRLIRIFEWIETGITDGHIHNLTESCLNKWLNGEGKVEQMNENTARGLCYYGIFPC